MSWIKWIPVVGQAISGVAWAVEKIKLRRKRKLTEAEREQAQRDAEARADRIFEEVKKARGK